VLQYFAMVMQGLDSAVEHRVEAEGVDFLSVAKCPDERAEQSAMDGGVLKFGAPGFVAEECDG
jgi:hypothetical protein